MSKNKEILLKAASQLGVKEAAGSKDNPQVREYHKFSTVKNLIGMADSIPWCASFICWVLENCGLASTNSQAARSFMKWGVNTKNPLPGDIVVFWRESLTKSYKGHVGIFLAKKGNLYYVLGGNQSDSVNISTYTDAKILGFRTSIGVPSLAEENELKVLAMDILDGKVVQTGGKVV